MFNTVEGVQYCERYHQCYGILKFAGLFTLFWLDLFKFPGCRQSPIHSFQSYQGNITKCFCMGYFHEMKDMLRLGEISKCVNIRRQNRELNGSLITKLFIWPYIQNLRREKHLAIWNIRTNVYHALPLSYRGARAIFHFLLIYSIRIYNSVKEKTDLWMFIAKNQKLRNITK